MTRSEVLEAVSKLMDVLNEEKKSPNEAKIIANVFERAVQESNDKSVKQHMESSIFHGSPPER